MDLEITIFLAFEKKKLKQHIITLITYKNHESNSEKLGINMNDK